MFDSDFAELIRHHELLRPRKWIAEGHQRIESGYYGIGLHAHRQSNPAAETDVQMFDNGNCTVNTDVPLPLLDSIWALKTGKRNDCYIIGKWTFYTDT